MSTSIPISRDKPIGPLPQISGGSTSREMSQPLRTEEEGEEEQEQVRVTDRPPFSISISFRPKTFPNGNGQISRSNSVQTKEKEKEKERVVIDKDLLPHPAEDLSADDDLLSWILVDQLGCMPNTKLGVHPQQVKFVGPTFKTDEVLNIVRETVTKGNIQGAMQRLQEFHLIKSHLESKMTDYQRERFVSHLRRYLLPLLPTSRLEIHLTSRYSFITGHTELAVFATRPLTPGLVMQELQGSVVPLPDQWREEMEIGEDFAVAVEAAGEETDSDAGGGSDDEDDDVSLHSSATTARKDKGKSREVENNNNSNGNTTRKGQRRSDRTKRRDFSIVWSGLKRCYQLFLGPARFLNHDCNPNVELLRQGKHVTFRVLKPIRIGDELTTFYGENYCESGCPNLCLTCEQKGVGGFTPVSSIPSGRNSRSNSRDSSAGPSRRDTPADIRESIAREIKNVGPSSLRNVVNGNKDDELDDLQSATTVEPSLVGDDTEEASLSVSFKDDNGEDSASASISITATPTKRNILKITIPPSPTTESVASEPDSPLDPPARRERIIRKVVQNIKPWSFLQRPKKFKKDEPSENDEESTEVTDDLPDDFPRCATCAKPLAEQIWFNGRYFEHCARCVRHAFIFELPWPSHRPQDVREYPPSHLLPSRYIPPKISTIPLPTLSKQPKYVKPIEVPVSPANETKLMRQARKLREQIAAEDFFVESLREAAWSAQESREAAAEAREAALQAQKEAKEEARRLRLEEKKQRDAKNIKGTGVWSRYAYLTEEDIRKKEAEKNQVLSGTRRGGRFRAREDEEEMKKLAEEKAREERRENLAGMGIEPGSPESSGSLQSNNQQQEVEEDEGEVEEEGDVSIASSSGTSTELVVDPRALVRVQRQIPHKITLFTRKDKEKGRVTVNEDEDDEMEVATSPVLSVIPPPKPTARNAVPSSSKPRPVSASTSTVFRPIAPKIPILPNAASRMVVSSKTTSPGKNTASKVVSSPILNFGGNSSSNFILKSTPITKYSPSTSSINRSPIIDLTLDSDDSDYSSNASGPESLKRKKGRPLGSGKHQKAAMKKLAKSQSQSQIGNGSVNSPTCKKSPIDLSFDDAVKSKVRDENRFFPRSLESQVIQAGYHHASSFGISPSKTTTRENHAGPSRPYSVHHLPPLPPAGSGSGFGSSKTSNGSGSTSSIDMAENALDKHPASSSSSSSTSPPGASASASASNGEMNMPKLKLNVNSNLTHIKINGWESSPAKNPAFIHIHPLAAEMNRLKNEEEERLSPKKNDISKSGSSSTSNLKGLSYENGKYHHGTHNVSHNGPLNGTHHGGTYSKEYTDKPPTALVAAGVGPVSSSSSSTLALNDKKRKRISDISEASSTSAPSSHQPEKKKRTFFTSPISVGVLKPTPPIPKPKHSIHP
ncbi:hypothetical protein L486_06984 [Kwoniella mangroviensis CBS 10435]|uniref:SET domain-containing protein n=1 Tax=Kwoniella mangroviensis CBS 10435 TaxID=1331196 RepID=A0A1B9IJF7_9TREE|nr:hypothetical protein L486_06984 [Kwoniella mangroviensis CBS 10435]